MPLKATGTDGTRSSGRSVTSKVVSLFDAFTVGDVELSLNELARRTGLPLSTAYRLAGELVAWGGLERAEGGGYRVGLRLLEVGARAPRSAGLHEIVVPFMQDLYVATRQNVHLAVLQGHEALYVERVTGLHSITVKSRRWGRMPLHATGVGKVLLAYAPDELVDAVIAQGLTRYTPYTIVAPGHLRRNLAEIRRTGVGIAHEEMRWAGCRWQRRSSTPPSGPWRRCRSSFRPPSTRSGCRPRYAPRRCVRPAGSGRTPSARNETLPACFHDTRISAM